MNNISASINIQSINSQKVTGLYQYGLSKIDKNDDANNKPLEIQDILDIHSNNVGSNGGKLPGYETVLAILEKHTETKIDASFKAEGLGKAEPTPEPNDYWSPENTGSRIVQFALGFYDNYVKKNGGENKENLDKFLGIVKGAIDEGIGSAEEIIGKANNDTIPDKIQNTIQKTRDHISKLLDDFRKEALGRIDSQKETSEPADNSEKNETAEEA
ncbi:MAG: hypothetical protein AUJ18_04285 [Candidatus Hydrogenedentes bacterium CG1_02_42_14]|nr:MAG: hypothetical protein AUJ18_04285 [Candidatus Hydrogenedentes bacterium CG1_02_42_14]